MFIFSFEKKNLLLPFLNTGCFEVSNSWKKGSVFDQKLTCFLFLSIGCWKMWVHVMTSIYLVVRPWGGPWWKLYCCLFLRYSASKIFQMLFCSTAVEHYTFVPVWVISPRFQSHRHVSIMYTATGDSFCECYQLIDISCISRQKNCILGVFLDCEWDLWNRLMITFIFSSLVIWTAVYFTFLLFYVAFCLVCKHIS